VRLLSPSMVWILLKDRSSQVRLVCVVSTQHAKHQACRTTQHHNNDALPLLLLLAAVVVLTSAQVYKSLVAEAQTVLLLNSTCLHSRVNSRTGFDISVV
jgi:hypothetical protein